MISLTRYIVEGARTTSSNADRRKELEAWLKNKKYPDYVDTLNKMLEDPKAKTLLVDGFGGELGDTKFEFAVKQIQANKLMPTQSEIDIDKSLARSINKPESIKNVFKEPVTINNMPLVTFNGEYVIDGHHRWIEAMAYNPEAKMLCFDYSADITPMKMLKAVQGAIASVLAETPEKDSIPSSKVTGQDAFKWKHDDIVDWCMDNITNDAAVEFSKEFDIETVHHMASIIADNIVNMQKNNSPENWAPKRELMPQTDKAGTEKGNKASATPTSKGSALNKLKDGKIAAAAI